MIKAKKFGHWQTFVGAYYRMYSSGTSQDVQQSFMTKEFAHNVEMYLGQQNCGIRKLILYSLCGLLSDVTVILM